jgi:hypothetical protein
LFITDDEVKKLKAMDANLKSFQELGIFKYDGPSQDLSLENNQYNALANSVFIPASEVLKVPTSGGYFLEFHVNGFSEFYVSTQNLSGPETPLPVEIISFSAKSGSVKGEVVLDWKTASEINMDRFEVGYSCDGRNFETIRSVAPEGSSSLGKNYHVKHRPNSCDSENLMYRLLAYDKGMESPTLERKAVVRNPLAGAVTIQVQNPVENQLVVTGLQGDGAEVMLLDALGRTCLETTTNNTELRMDVRHLPAGLYRLRVMENGNPETIAIIIR